MAKRRIQPARPVYPSPAALITSADREGKANIVTLGECFNVSIARPVILGIAIRTATYSYGLIREAGEFVVNLPTAALVEKVDGIGSVSGRTCDKFERFGLTALPADEVRPPLIAECPINVECKLREVIEVGDHDTFVGEVVAVHADQELLDEEGRVCMDRLDAFAFMFCYGTRGEYWSLDKKIGEFGFSRNR